MSDIFGKHSGSTYNEGLVDCTSEKGFSERLEKCRAIWNTREAPYAPTSGPLLFNYFLQYKSDTVYHNMRADSRESVAVRCSPHTMMKQKVNYKESELMRKLNSS